MPARARSSKACSRPCCGSARAWSPLGLTGVAVRIAQLAALLADAARRLLIGVMAVLVLGYVNKSAGWFPKYQVALAPLLACLAAPLHRPGVVPRARAWPRRHRRPRALVSARSHRTPWCATLGAAAHLGDRRRPAPGCSAWSSSPCWPRCPGAPRPPPALAAALLDSALGWSLARRRLPAVARPTQTDYWYGTSGTVEAAAGSTRTCSPARRTSPPRRSPSSAATSATSTRTTSCTSLSTGRRLRRHLGRRAAAGAGDLAARAVHRRSVRARSWQTCRFPRRRASATTSSTRRADDGS